MIEKEGNCGKCKHFQSDGMFGLWCDKRHNWEEVTEYCVDWEGVEKMTEKRFIPIFDFNGNKRIVGAKDNGIIISLEDMLDLLNSLSEENENLNISVSAYMVNLSNSKGECSVLMEENEQLKQEKELLLQTVDGLLDILYDADIGVLIEESVAQMLKKWKNRKCEE